VAQGEAEREVVRVPVECCLQEAGWNPYYALLLTRLAAAAAGHAVTLQYCLWDHFRVGAASALQPDTGAQPRCACLWTLLPDSCCALWLQCCLTTLMRVQ
jgi:MA3 domain